MKTCTTFYSGEIPHSFSAIGHTLPNINFSLVPIESGDSHQWNRAGNIVSLQYLLVKGVVYLETDVDSLRPHFLPPMCTVALVQDTQTNGVLFDSGIVFGNFSGSSIGNACIQRSLFDRERFIVHRQEVFDLSNFAISHDEVGIPTYGPAAKTFEWFIPLHGLTVHYKGPSKFTDIVDHSFQMCAFSTVPVSSLVYPNSPKISFSAVARYFSEP